MYNKEKGTGEVLMANLLKRIEARMADPELNANFNREVSKYNEVTVVDQHNYALAKEAFQEYKKKDPNWMQHFD